MQLRPRKGTMYLPQGVEARQIPWSRRYASLIPGQRRVCHTDLLIREVCSTHPKKIRCIDSWEGAVLARILGEGVITVLTMRVTYRYP